MFLFQSGNNNLHIPFLYSSEFERHAHCVFFLATQHINVHKDTTKIYQSLHDYRIITFSVIVVCRTMLWPNNRYMSIINSSRLLVESPASI